MLSTPALALLRSEYENMLACVRCGQCLTSCPTYVLTMNEAEGPRGRIAMARALVDGQLTVTLDLLEHEANCLVCDACTAVCPAGVHMDPLQVALRQALAPSFARSQKARMFRSVGLAMLEDLGRLRLAVRGLALYQRLGLKMGSLFGMGEAESLLPARVSGGPFVAGGGSGDVAFFAGCVMSTAMADVDRATVRVLERAGLAVAAPVGQGCCGALHAHLGELERAKPLFKRNIDAFEGTEGPIVVNAAGCSAMLRDYAHHLPDEPRAKAFSARVRDVSQVLVDRELPMRELRRTVAYQDACHLAHAQRITAEPRSLLMRIPGLELRELRDGALCCGSAGVYNLTNPVQARALRERKVDAILATGADVVATGNPGCLLQIQAGLAARGSAVQVKHTVELLDEATAA